MPWSFPFLWCGPGLSVGSWLYFQDLNLSQHFFTLDILFVLLLALNCPHAELGGARDGGYTLNLPIAPPFIPVFSFFPGLRTLSPPPPIPQAVPCTPKDSRPVRAPF